MKSIVRRLALVASAAFTVVGVVIVPANAAVDRDCGDFGSQNAAQIFYRNLWAIP